MPMGKPEFRGPKSEPGKAVKTATLVHEKLVRL